MRTSAVTEALSEKHSLLSKLQSVLEHCLHFIHNAKGKEKRTGVLTIAELNASMNRIIQLTQAKEFSREINCLQGNKLTSHNSKLFPLNPFLDNGILKVGGRLVNFELTHEKKHPILLPRYHHITTLIIRDEHLRLQHAGTKAIL